MASTVTPERVYTSPEPAPTFDLWKALTAIAAVLALVLAVVAIGGFRAEPAATPESPAALEAARSVDLEEIAADPTDIPSAIGARGPTTVQVTLEATEVVAELSEGVTYEYWTFNDQVPGPMIRVREGDTVEMTIRNPEGNRHVHSIDLHAVLGPGGGKVHTDTPPGEERTFAFQAMRPGLYVYHCASEHIPSHITSGMYGLILVEPAGGLPSVDEEFYVMQADMYTTGAHGQEGHHELDMGELAAEDPTYVVFNGRPGSLTDERAMQVRTGESIRVFVGNGGPNLVSSFHIIGEIFDRLYAEGDIVSAPRRNVQTTLVPAGGATMIEFEAPVPGTYLLVDHSLSRAVDKGALGHLVVEGAERPEIFRSLNDATDDQAQGGDAVAGVSGDVITVVGRDDLRFEPDELTVEAGTYRLGFVNEGRAVHQLALNPVGEHMPSGQVHMHMADTGEVAGGETSSFEVTLEPGTYEYSCHVAGHYEAGMKGTLTVE